MHTSKDSMWREIWKILQNFLELNCATRITESVTCDLSKSTDIDCLPWTVLICANGFASASLRCPVGRSADSRGYTLGTDVRGSRICSQIAALRLLIAIANCEGSRSAGSWRHGLIVWSKVSREMSQRFVRSYLRHSRSLALYHYSGRWRKKQWWDRGPGKDPACWMLHRGRKWSLKTITCVYPIDGHQHNKQVRRPSIRLQPRTRRHYYPWVLDQEQLTGMHGYANFDQYHLLILH